MRNAEAFCQSVDQLVVNHYIPLVLDIVDTVINMQFHTQYQLADKTILRKSSLLYYLKNEHEFRIVRNANNLICCQVSLYLHRNLKNFKQGSATSVGHMERVNLCTIGM